MAQQTVNFYQPLGYEGQIISSGQGSIRGALRSYQNKSGGIIPFGRALVNATGSKSLVQLPSGTGQSAIGISVFNDFQEGVPIWNAPEQGYPNNSDVSVLIQGPIDICVWSEVATNLDDPVYFRCITTNPTTNPLGRFSNTAGADFTQITNARFIYASSGAGLSVINIGGF